MLLLHFDLSVKTLYPALCLIKCVFCYIELFCFSYFFCRSPTLSVFVYLCNPLIPVTLGKKVPIANESLPATCQNL